MPRRDAARLEKENHRKAFELYYAQGEKRSFSRLAKELGVSVASLKTWSRSFSWQKRLWERDAQAARQLADQSSHRGQAENERNLKIVRAALIYLARDITSGNLKQLSELDKLIRLEEHLMGFAAPGEASGARTSNPVVILPDDGSDPDFSFLRPDGGGAPGFEPTELVNSVSIPREEVTIPHAEA
jgi:hypothetical protein